LFTKKTEKAAITKKWKLFRLSLSCGESQVGVMLLWLRASACVTRILNAILSRHFVFLFVGIRHQGLRCFFFLFCGNSRLYNFL